jgi:dihydroflavonol-4-reductase
LTGATGFVGGHVARALVEAGYRVRALVRESNGSNRSDVELERSSSLHARSIVALDGIETVSGDLLRAGDLARAMDGCRYLVHCAALYSFAPRDRAQMRLVNVAGTASLLGAAHVAGVERAVVTSSSATVGPARDGRPAHEGDHADDGHPSAYHRSKILQERAALAARVPTVLLLPTTPVGPGDRRPTPTGRLVLDFARGRVFARPPGAGGLNIVAVEDVAQAHVFALQRGGARERYLIGGENFTFAQLWQALSEATGRPVPRWTIPYGLAVALGYADEMRCRMTNAAPTIPLEGLRMSQDLMHVESAKAMTELGYRPSSARDALARAVAWYSARGDVS